MVLAHNMHANTIILLLHVPIPNILFYNKLSFHFIVRIAFLYRFLQYIKLVKWSKAKSSYAKPNVVVSSNLTLTHNFIMNYL